MRWLGFAMIVAAACQAGPPTAVDPAGPAREGGEPRTAAVLGPANPPEPESVPEPVPEPPVQQPLPTPPPARPSEPPFIAPLAGPAETIPSAPGGEIEALAVTEDGAAAVTSDAGGGIRIWPTLDGTREPVVVLAARAASLALVRDRAELVIADLDPAGALEVVRTSATGAPAGRAAVPSDRPYTLVRATSHGLLALRDDQVLDVVDLHGGRIGQLAAHPGERVLDVLVRHDRALATVVTGHRLQARWITFGDAPAWGGTAALPFEPTLPIVLAPDHRHVAGVDAVKHVPAIFDLGTGAETEPVDDAGANEAHPLTSAAHPVGFLDAHTVVLDDRGQLAVWMEASSGLIEDGVSVLSQTAGPNVVADHRFIGARLGQLVLATPGRPVQYLGYRMAAASALHRTGGHWFVGQPAVHPEWTELDDDLAVRRIIAPPPAAGPYLTAIPLDELHGLAITGIDNGPHSLVRYTLGSNEVEVLRDNVGPRLEYEPASHLVAVDAPNGTTFFRVDPKTSALGPPMETTLEGTIYLVDPARAEGRIAVAIVGPEGDVGGATVTPIHSICPACPNHVKAGRPQHVRFDAGDVTQLRTLHDLTHIADLTPLVRASPDGQRIVSFANNRVTLRDASGQTRWTIALPGVTAVVWSERGDLVALANGLVRIDVETGALRERRCGWLFELSYDASFDVMPPVVCDAPSSPP